MEQTLLLATRTHFSLVSLLLAIHIIFLYFGLVIILPVLAFKSKSFIYKQRSSVCYNFLFIVVYASRKIPCNLGRIV